MSSDMFSSANARELLRGKTVYLFGDSNTRALYKDLLWLLEDGRIIPNAKLKCKNELSHANDVRLSSGKLHSGRNYKEVRSYSENPHIMFHFMTRLYLPDFIDTIKNLKHEPDVLALNSCVWDLTRWGSNGVEQFKHNVEDTFSFLKSHLPSTRIIWLTTLPPSFKSRGGFLTKEIEFLRNMLPWHMMFANKYVVDLAVTYNIDVLDMHYNFRLLLNYHTKDGIHWVPIAMRYATNLLLTHIALCWNHKLPGAFELDRTFIERSHLSSNSTEIKSNETVEQKLKSNVGHNTAITKSKKFENGQRRRTRNRRLQSICHEPRAFNNCRKWINQQNQGVSFSPPINVPNYNFTAEPTYSKNVFSNEQPTPNVWYRDYPVDNFENTFSMTEQNQQNVFQDPYHPNNVINAHYQQNSVYQFNSQVSSLDAGFRNQRNVRNRSRIDKRKTKKNNLELAYNIAFNM